MTLRVFPLLAALVLGACAERPAAPPADAGPEADSARALLTRVPPSLAADAFRRLDGLAYTADVRLDEIDDAGGPADSASRTVRRWPGPDGLVRERLVAGDGGGGLPVRGAFGPMRLADPVGQMLPGDPPHLAPRTRDRYRLHMLPPVERGGRRLVGAEAALRDPADNEPIRRVRSWVDADTGAPYAVEVWRTSRSAIFDESGQAGVVFADGPGGLVPAGGRAETTVDVPFGPPRHLILSLGIRDVE